MSESVYHVLQLGKGAGTMSAPGASVAAKVIFPVTEAVVIELDRATSYPDREDYGRNVKNHSGRGRHGARGATFSIPAEFIFQNAMELLELHYAGAIVPTGVGPYTWVYPFSAGAPTLIPATVETGSETGQDQYESVFLIDELTLGFDDLNAPGAHPWMADAACVGLNSVVAALTGSLAAPATLETMQGHLSIIKLGTTATLFASLAELAASLVAFSVTTRRFLTLRIYGGTSDVPTSIAFSEKSTGDVTFKVAISSGNKAAILDAWNAAGSVLGEQRLRVTVDGNGDNVAHFDARIGMIKVTTSERDSERVYEVTAEIVDDATLNGPCQWTVINSVATLGST